jgi:hypothetical protein
VTAAIIRQDADAGDRPAVYQDLMDTGLFDPETAERMTDSLLASAEELLEEQE